MKNLQAKPSHPHRGDTLGRSFVILTLARLFSALVQALVLSAAARSMQQNDFGIFAGLLGTAAVAVVLADVGTTPVIIRAAAEGIDREVRRALALSRKSALAVFVLWLSLAWVAPLNVVDLFAVSGMAFYVLAERLYEGNAAVLIGQGSVTGSAYRLILRRAALLVSVVTALLIGAESLLQFCIAVIIPSLGFLLSDAVSAARVYRKQFASRTAASNAPEGAPRAWRHTYANSVGVHARQLDVPLLAAILGAGVTAPYAAVSRLINPARLVSASLASALLATASRQPFRDYHRPVCYLLVANLMAAMGTIAFARPIILVLFGNRYAEAVLLLQLAAPGFAASGMCAVYTSLLQARHRERAVASISVSSCVMTIVGVMIAAMMQGFAVATAILSVGYTINLLALRFLYGRDQRSVQIE